MPLTCSSGSSSPSKDAAPAIAASPSRSSNKGNSVTHRSNALHALLAAGLVIAPTACSTGSDHPAATSSSSVTASTTTSEHAAPSVQGSTADTINIGASGVRCLAGQKTVACVTMDHKGLTTEGNRAFSFVRTDDPEGGVEPGFAPGKHPQAIAAGDLVFIDTSNCRNAGTADPNVAIANCNALMISDSVIAANSKNVIVGIISRVSAQGLTVCAADTVFDIPVPPVANAGRAVYRPDAGQQLNSGQSIKVRDYWTFTLKDETLTISSPGGVTIVHV
ncbi:Uncharacterised protein [Mycobacteroides abscessus subsp. abscessus]|nr:Uncharacterised protein [Mycobacteroides abscessus subsp. abscessus]